MREKWMERAVCAQLDPELFFDPACEAEAVDGVP